MAEDLYRRLQKQLDQYSMGFPATESGIEIRILKKLFSEKDAEVFLGMTPKLETPEEIAPRVNRPVQELAERLDDMADRGLLFRLKRGDTSKYGAIPFVHGLFEFQVKDLDRDLADLVKAYMEDAFEKNLVFSASEFLRTIPVQRSVDARQKIAPYEDAREILEKAGNIVVTECICRKAAKKVDKGCDKPVEVCFMFGSMGQYYLDRKMGRKVDVEEALKILAEAQEAGLVTQPATAQNPGGMCNCCGDCCGPLAALNKHPRPAEMVFSNYFAEVDRGLCTGCEICVERCQMGAVAMDSDALARIDPDRCIGCGLCVTTCPTEAVSLERKPEGSYQVPPATTLEQMMAMAKKRGVI